jgi:hypothetical protein
MTARPARKYFFALLSRADNQNSRGSTFALGYSLPKGTKNE